MQRYVAELEGGIADYYEKRGGRMTWTRKAYLAEELAKHPAERVLCAVEVYSDGHYGTKDERYAVGIARRLALLSGDELERDMNQHRRRQKGRGLYAGIFGTQS